jgi:quinol monooxygenase YgiN
MYTVIVNLQVKPDRVEAFLNHFVLYQLYADERAFTEAHRGAPHYERWRAASAGLLEPGGQVNTFATPAFPDDLPEAVR